MLVIEQKRTPSHKDRELSQTVPTLLWLLIVSHQSDHVAHITVIIQYGQVSNSKCHAVSLPILAGSGRPVISKAVAAEFCTFSVETEG